MANTTITYRGYGIDYFTLKESPIYSVTIKTACGTIAPAFRTEWEAENFIDELYRQYTNILRKEKN